MNSSATWRLMRQQFSVNRKMLFGFIGIQTAVHLVMTLLIRSSSYYSTGFRTAYVTDGALITLVLLLAATSAFCIAFPFLMRQLSFLPTTRTARCLAVLGTGLGFLLAVVLWQTMLAFVTQGIVWLVGRGQGVEYLFGLPIGVTLYKALQYGTVLLAYGGVILFATGLVVRFGPKAIAGLVLFVVLFFTQVETVSSAMAWQEWLVYTYGHWMSFCPVILCMLLGVAGAWLMRSRPAQWRLVTVGNGAALVVCVGIVAAISLSGVVDKIPLPEPAYREFPEVPAVQSIVAEIDVTNAPQGKRLDILGEQGELIWWSTPDGNPDFDGPYPNNAYQFWLGGGSGSVVFDTELFNAFNANTLRMTCRPGIILMGRHDLSDRILAPRAYADAEGLHIVSSLPREEQKVYLLYEAFPCMHNTWPGSQWRYTETGKYDQGYGFSSREGHYDSSACILEKIN